VDALAWRFVDPTAEVERERSTTLRELHEFSILVRFLNASLTLDEAQEYANYEALWLADTLSSEDTGAGEKMLTPMGYRPSWRNGSLKRTPPF
jgi:hypothetical protein